MMMEQEKVEEKCREIFKILIEEGEKPIREQAQQMCDAGMILASCVASLLKSMEGWSYPDVWMKAFLKTINQMRKEDENEAKKYF